MAFELVSLHHEASPRLAHGGMKELFTARQKQYILSLYSARRKGRTFAALAARFDVPGGKRTIQRWNQQYDGTLVSLEHQSGQGRPRTLTRTQASRLVLDSIRRKNRAHRPIHYETIISRVLRNSGKNVSARTIRRYGKEDSGIKQKRTQKITVNERACTIPMRERMN